MFKKTTVVINRNKIGGRVYAAGLYMALLDQSKLGVTIGGNGVTYTGTENEMARGEVIVKAYAEEHGDAPQ